MKFAVLSMNPGIDRALYLPAPLQPGEMNRASRTVTSQGSKGANVAVMLTRLGCDVTYYSFNGGIYGEVCDRMLEREGVRAVYVPSACGIRVNTKVIDSEGGCTELNERGGPFSPAEAESLTEAFESSGADVFVLTGSLPSGVSPDYYAALIPRLKAKGAAVALDCDGAAFAKAVGTSPDVIKPNLYELRGLLKNTGTEPSGSPAGDAAAVCAKYGIGTVLLTMGADGSLLVSGGVSDFCPSAKVTLRGFAAAGDCFLSGYLCAVYERGMTQSEAHLFASSCGAAKVMLEGTYLPDAASVTALYTSRKASL